MLLLSLLNIYMRFFQLSNIKPNKPLSAEKARISALKAHVKSAKKSP
jgi:hypothetical protein